MRFFTGRIIYITLLLIAALGGFVLSLKLHDTLPPIESSENSSHAAHYPLLFVRQLKNDPLAGRKIFHEYCAVCHAKEPEIDVHAPRFGDRATWSALKTVGEKKLFQWTSQGHGAMPARGGCFECSDQQLKEAIRYLENAS